MSKWTPPDITHTIPEDEAAFLKPDDRQKKLVNEHRLSKGIKKQITHFDIKFLCIVQKKIK